MRLAYSVYNPVDSNRRNDVPVIMLHGAFDCRKAWRCLAPAIANATGRTVYTIDLRSHGESPWSDQSNDNNVVMDLVQFMEEHKIAKAAFVGHSLGGYMSVKLALEKPENVEKIVVEDIAMDATHKHRKIVLKMMHLLKASLSAIPPNASEYEAKKAVNEYLKKFSYEGASSKGFFHDLEAMPLKKVGDGYEWQTNIKAFEKELKNDFIQKYSNVFKGDALFLYGEKSFIDVASDKLIPKHFPRCRKLCFEGVGHFLHQDEPEKFLETVINFIGK